MLADFRFDIIFLLLDKVDASGDKELSRHIISLYSLKENSTNQTSFVSPKLLSSCITHCRELKPKLSDEASEMIALAYVNMRKMNGTGTKTISATTRQLESIIRISEAHSKMRYYYVRY